MKIHSIGFGCLVLSFCVLAVGCGGQRKVATGNVTGVVTFEGKPVEVGVINFESDEGTGAGAEAEIVDGDFSFKSIPVGNYKVTVMPQLVDPQPGMVRPPDPQDIPHKYRTPKSSDLTAKITAGENSVSFDLKK